MTLTDQEKILSFLKFTGPTTASRVAKNIKQELLFTCAHLSDLRSQGKVKITYLKVGTSPLYFLAGQEDQLYQFAAGNINPKDLEVLATLKERKILAEASLDLLGKVAIRSLKDFAIPLHVTLDGKTGLFWKWHLLSTEEANQIISDIVNQIMQKNQPQPAPTPVSAVPEQLPAASGMLPQQEIEQPLLDVQSKPKIVAEKSKLRKPKKEQQQKIKASQMQLQKEQAMPEPAQQITKPERDTAQTGEKEAVAESQISINQKPTRKIKEEDILLRAEDFFSALQVIIELTELVRKNAEFNLIIQVPSAVGSVKYFCKLKHKAKCDEKDLSSAYVEAQGKKLPLLFLYSQSLTKKAEELLMQGTLENVIVKRLE